MKRFTLTVASLLMGMTAVMAQNTKVTGQVLDENGEPVIGASVVVKGTTIGTVTDFDGNFTLDVPSNGGKASRTCCRHCRCKDNADDSFHFSISL